MPISMDFYIYNVTLCHLTIESGENKLLIKMI